MPNGIDDSQLDDDLDPDASADGGDGEADGDTDADADADGEGGEDGKPKGDPEKRIRDLQSKADAAEARANRAEAALKSRKQGEGSGGDPATKALMTELREASLDAVFGEYPVLRDYGIDRSLIEGSTRAELRENATSLVALIKNVETKARNKALADAGVKAEPAGSVRAKPVDYASMSDEAFLKLLDS